MSSFGSAKKQTMHSSGDNGGVWKDFYRQAESAARRSHFYSWLTAPSETPQELRLKLSDPWPGEADIGQMMVRGVFVRNGMSLPLDEHFWDTVDRDSSLRETVHGFTWLRDLRAAGGDVSRRMARRMIEEWLARYDRRDETAWRPDVMGQRIVMWISFYDFFCASAEEDFQKLYFDSLTRQAKHLARHLPGKLNGIKLLRAAEGLIYAGLSLTEQENWTLRGFEIILREIPQQIRKDGSHISGSPEDILSAAQILLDLRYALTRADLPIPRTIRTALDATATALRFLTYPDRKLALFHGGQEGDLSVLNTIQSQIRNPKRPAKSLTLTGFERVMQGRSVLMIDTGTPSESPYDRTYHSAPLAFEFVVGRDRVFTNCGGHPFDADWQEGLRHTAAHNSLLFRDKPVHDFGGDGGIPRPHSPICSVRREVPEACLIDVSHDAFRAAHGVDHKRRFFLTNQGQDFRGEDTLLARIPLTTAVPATLRFHVHPRVLVSPIDENGDIYLTLPVGSTWRFSAVGGEVSVESSIYLGHGVKPEKSKQIVIRSAMSSDSLQIKWALQRV